MQESLLSDELPFSFKCTPNLQGGDKEKELVEDKVSLLFQDKVDAVCEESWNKAYFLAYNCKMNITEKLRYLLLTGWDEEKGLPSR